MNHPWHTGPLCGFDLETTGVDTANDRIITAAIVNIRPQQETQIHTWTIDPGITIPAEATAIHGITNEHIAMHGRQPAEAINEIITTLTNANNNGTPIVGMNVSFDLTMLLYEAQRHGLPQHTPHPVVDIRVLDKQIDRYRKGGRKLTDLANHYRIDLADNNAHDASYDAITACRIAYRIAQQYPQLQIDLHELHALQQQWAAQQHNSFAEYRQKIGQPIEDHQGWPTPGRPGGTLPARETLLDLPTPRHASPSTSHQL